MSAYEALTDELIDLVDDLDQMDERDGVKLLHVSYVRRLLGDILDRDKERRGNGARKP